MHDKDTTNPTVLLVDDDPAIRESVGQLLEEQGADVTPVATLAEAKSNLKNGSFALVLTDLRLKLGTEGLDVARTARKTDPDAHVVLFSGQDLSDLEDEAT